MLDPLTISSAAMALLPELFSASVLESALSFLGSAGSAVAGAPNFAMGLLSNPQSAFNASTYSNYWNQGTVPGISVNGSGTSPLGFMLDPIGSLMAREDNKEEAHKARKQQLWMFQNQTQVRVKDMKKAGMNPILSVSPGAGASMPSGVAQASFTNPFVNTASSASSLASMMSTLMGMKNLSATYDATKANTALTLQQAEHERTKNTLALIDSQYASSRQKKALMRMEIENAKAQNDYNRSVEDRFAQPSASYRRKMAELMPFLQLSVNSTDPAGALAAFLKMPFMMEAKSNSDNKYFGRSFHPAQVRMKGLYNDWVDRDTMMKYSHGNY